MLMPPIELKAILDAGIFGLLVYVIWWGCNRVVKSNDDLKQSIDDGAEDNRNLTRVIGFMLIKFKDPHIDLKEEAQAVLSAVDKHEQELEAKKRK